MGRLPIGLERPPTAVFLLTSYTVFRVVRRGQAPEPKRERTRRALIDAALKRFADRGVAATTAAEIASDAGVTERTFYRYFANKEEILFVDYEERVDWFRAALQLRPQDEPITQSVRYAVEAFPGDHRLVSEAGWLQSTELTGEVAAMHLRRVHTRLGHEIEQHLLATTYPDPADALKAAVIANMVVAAVSAAMTQWSRSFPGQPKQLRAILQEALAIADQGIATVMSETGTSDSVPES